jgi:uncharacterized protein (TIGR02246 family)
MITGVNRPYVNTKEDSPVWFLGLPTAVRATGENTNGAFGLVESWTMPPGFASPYHVHHREDEAFYVMEGELAVICDGKWIKAGPGTYVFGPREIPHGFKVVGSAAARMLLLCTPAGFEHFVLELSEPATDLTSAPPPPDMAKLMAVAAKYQIDILGPLPEQTGSGSSEAKSDAEVIEAVRAAHVAALNTRDAAEWAGLFTEDAVQMPPNAPANVGRANILTWSNGLLRAFRVKFALSVSELQVVDDRAFESGSYTITLTPDSNGRANEDNGKYVTIYQRLSSGGWAITRDIWNSNQPLPGMG